MTMRYRRGTAMLASAAALVLAFSGCVSDRTPETANPTAGSGEVNCDAFKQFGDLNGKEVSVFAAIAADEAEPYIASFKAFEKCTGATIKYEGSKDFETQIGVRVSGGSAPDIAFVPQPGMLQTLVKTGKAKEAPAETVKNVDDDFGADWKAYGTVDGKFYAAPLGAAVKSLVWYSPKTFKDKGYEVPKTWADLMTLTEKIANENSDAKPWCQGFGSGASTGWPGTDWIEDMVLRTSSPDVYDKWVKHEIPFNDPQILKAWDEAGKILLNDKYVNGGFGDHKTIASTTFQDAGTPILTNKCFMYKQASFYASVWPAGTNVAEDGDAWAFYLPGQDEASKPVLGAADFALAFADRPEVKAFQTYLSSGDWANERAKASPKGGAVSANKKLDTKNLSNAMDKLSVEILTDEKATFRFDGSDQMPSAVGAGTFWQGIVDWIAKDKPASEVTGTIESNWPK